MGDYYNTTRGPLSVTLQDGSACAISPKSWIYVAPGNENSASISKFVQKGYLVKAAVARTAPPPAPTVAQEQVAQVQVQAVQARARVAPEVAPEAVPEVRTEPPVEAKPLPVVTASASTSSMKEEIFRKKR